MFDTQIPVMELKLSLWQVEPQQSLLENNKSLIVKTEFYTNQNKTLGVYPRLSYFLPENTNSQFPLKLTFNLRAQLLADIPTPYYHLHYSKDLVSSKLWKDTLDWQIRQCQTATSASFDCLLTVEDIASLKNKKETLMVDWSYNTEGPVAIERPLNIEVNLDNQWQNYQLLITGGGENLKNISIIYSSFPGIIEIDNVRLEYLK